MQDKTTYSARIDELIDSWRDEMFDTLKGWVAINSIKGEPEDGAPFGRAPRKALDLALSDAAAMGLAVRNLDGYAGDVTLNEGGQQTMGILAHLDIVPAGDGWSHDPFDCYRKDGRVYGRGTQDDKGPAVAALYALRAVKEAGIPLKDRVRLILGTDEESGSGCIRHYKEVAETPDYGFSPDADYPLINIEKGGIAIEIGAFSAGEADARIPIYSMEAGQRVNIVPGTARAVVGTASVSADQMRAALSELPTEAMPYRIEVTDLGDGKARIEAFGVQSHASLPHLGLNSIGLLMKALTRLGAGGGIAPAVKAVAEKFGTEGDGASAGLKTDDPECGPLTCNMGLLRFDGQVMSVRLDIRWPLATSPEKMLGGLGVALAGTPLVMRCFGWRGVHYVSPEHKVVKGLLQVYHDVTGLPAYPIAIGGGTYSSMMPNNVAFGICFPGDVDTCHMPDEYVDWEKFILSVKVFAHAIEKLAGA